MPRLRRWASLRFSPNLARMVLFAALITGLSAMWASRDFVATAYEERESRGQLRLTGLDLTIEPSEIEPSPFWIDNAPDSRQVALSVTQNDVEIEPASPIKIVGGESRLSGVVVGPDGPIPFATIRLERHTSEGTIGVDVTSDGVGRWTARQLQGGRYRVRAWRPGEATMAGSEVLFLEAKEWATLDLELDEVDPTPTLSYTDRGKIYQGLSGTIAISVTTRTVDDEGISVIAGLPGAIVTVSPSSGVVIGPVVAVTDGDGVARFTVRCLGLGRPFVIASHGELQQSFGLPECVPIPPPPPPPDPAATPTPQPQATVPSDG